MRKANMKPFYIGFQEHNSAEPSIQTSKILSLFILYTSTVTVCNITNTEKLQF